MSVREALNFKKASSSKDQDVDSPNANDHSDDEDNDAKFDACMRLQILRKQQELG